MYSMYSKELTGDDKKAGFVLAEVEPGQQGVMFRLGPSDRVLKMVDPAGCIRYTHQRYGKYEFQAPDAPATWKPAFEEYALDPVNAIRLARENEKREASIRIIPSLAC
jgi:hypothetical protein